MLDQLAYIEFQIKQTEEEINHHMQLIDSMITTIPGIGIVIGATIFGKIGDIQRFLIPKNWLPTQESMLRSHNQENTKPHTMS